MEQNDETIKEYIVSFFNNTNADEITNLLTDCLDAKLLSGELNAMQAANVSTGTIRIIQLFHKLEKCILN